MSPLTYTEINNRVLKKVGVKDIAVKAGVSIGTVDRVLHNRGEVKKETKDKVLAIVEELGYKPNVLARSLAKKTITRIVLVIPDSSDNNPYWEKPVHGINKATEELASHNIEVSLKHFDASNEASFKEALEQVIAENPDGIVLNPVFKSVSLHFISIFNKRKIPYVFIDVNIKGVGKLGYFGQDAEQSGVTAAKLMKCGVGTNAKILILKQANKKIFSQHIESRISGFLKFFEEDIKETKVTISSLEIDLQNTKEPDHSLSEIFKENSMFDGIFVPNSRAFLVADFIKKTSLSKSIIIAYDLVDRNIAHLEEGNLSFLISQKPEEQAYNAIMALFDHLILKKEVRKTTISPIDIIIKENIDFYKIPK